MRKNQTQNIAEIIAAIMKQNGFEEKLTEVRIKHAWEELLGKTVAKYTKSIFLKKDILYVTMSSSIVRNEIMLIRDDLLKKLNEKAEREIIKKIVVR